MRPVARLSDSGQCDSSSGNPTRVLEAPGASGEESLPEATIIFPPEQYIALEGLEFGWDKRLLPQVKQWWEEGVPGWEIAERLGRDQDETAILLMSMRREEQGSSIAIRDRPGDWVGKAMGSGVHPKPHKKDKRKLRE
jgi:hypothetical protein